MPAASAPQPARRRSHNRRPRRLSIRKTERGDAVAGTLAVCVESDVARSGTRAAVAGVDSSGLGGTAGEGGESTRVSSADVGGATACFDALGAKTDSVVAFGICGPPGSSHFVPTHTDATPSAITAPAGSDHFRTT